MTIALLSDNEYHPYYKTYLDLLGDTQLMVGLQEGLQRMKDFMSNLDSGLLEKSYGADKWTLAEVLVHLIDTERIFQYRALRFARNDKTALAGFDQDAFVPESGAAQKNTEELWLEFNAVRLASIALFGSFDDAKLQRIGTASGAPMSVRALGLMISAHQVHHERLLAEHYL